MFDLGQIVTYVLVVVALFLVPGPAVLLTIARGISGGARVGIATGAGIAVGDALHTLLAVLGLSAILMASALAFQIVKYLGVAYLIYLGICAFLEPTGDIDLPNVQRVTPLRAFRQAVLTEVLNPKTALFFLAFLPQFVDPARGAVWAQLLVLGAIFVVMSIAYTSLLALAAASVAGRLLRHRAIGRWRGKLMGIIYLGLGVQLALQEQR
jgi:threonine/homoserine/homoserine lactone efflux protein